MNIAPHGPPPKSGEVSTLKALPSRYNFSSSRSLHSPLLAQIGGKGSIQGIITDPSGTTFPSVSVTAIKTATQLRSVRQTTADLYVLSPEGDVEFKMRNDNQAGTRIKVIGTGRGYWRPGD